MTKKAFESIKAGLMDAIAYFESDAAAIRPQYHFRPSPKGLQAWDIRRLIKQARMLPIINVPLSQIREINEPYWFQYPASEPTCRAVIEHTKLINAVSLDYPIILFSDGSVADGMHRVCRALMEGRDTIKAIRFITELEPDYVGVAPEDLPY